VAHLRGEIPKIVTEMAAEDDLNAIISKLNTGLTDGWEEETIAQAFEMFQEEVLNIIKRGCIEKEGSAIMPMSVRYDLVMAMNECLSNKVLVDKLYQNICSISTCDMTLFSLSIFDLLSKVIEYCCLHIFSKALSSLPVTQAGGMFVKGDAGNVLTHQLIHHVAGFALFHHVSHARKYPKNKRLQRMKNCILSNMVKTGLPPVLSDKEEAY